MDFFDKLGDTLMTATKEEGQKAKGMSDLAKLQYELKCKEDDLKKEFDRLGRKYYQPNKDVVPTGDLDCFEDIVILRIRLEDFEILRKRLNALYEGTREKKGARACPRCGAKVAENAASCSTCGEKINDMFEED